MPHVEFIPCLCANLCALSLPPLSLFFRRPNGSSPHPQSLSQNANEPRFFAFAARYPEEDAS